MNTDGQSVREDDARGNAPPRSGPLGYTYEWIRLEKAIFNLPYTIMPDSQRAMIGVYSQEPTQRVTLTPLLSQDGATISVFQNLYNLELRTSTHGPVVQDGWTLDGDAGAVVTLCLVSREGGLQ